MEPLVLRTERVDVLLRRSTEEDVPALRKLVIRNITHWDWKYDTELDTVRKILVTEKGVLQLSVRLRREVIGHFYLSLLDGPLYGVIGYHLDERHTGNGYATICLRALALFAFDSLELQQLNAVVVGDRKKSIRLLERAGFVLIDIRNDGRFYELRAAERSAQSRP